MAVLPQGTRRFPRAVDVTSLMARPGLDGDAAAALRVIRYFDSLVERGVSAGELVQATAVIAECGCGLALGDGRSWRFGPRGNVLSDSTFGASTVADFEMGDTSARLWLERPGITDSLDDLVVERASLAARILLMERQPHNAADLADPVLVEVVLSSRESAADRCRALRRLGLVPELPLRVVAVSVEGGRDAAAEAVGLLARGRPTRSVYVTVISGVAAVLFQTDAESVSPAAQLRTVLRDRKGEQRPSMGLRVGVGSSVESMSAEKSWKEALLALRFALPPGVGGYAGDPGDAIVEYDVLGVLALLADVPAGGLLSQPDVVALNALGSTESGALDISALEAFCRTGSLRQAAQQLYLHHSTVAARLARIEETMGWHLDDPVDRFRAQFTLWARRLANTLVPH